MSKKFGFIAVLLYLSGLAYADQGGSDTFGYMWTDSETGTTIGYDWIDIKSSDNKIIHQLLNDGISPQGDPVGKELPFDFQFYGEAQDSIYISPNGFVSFSNIGSNRYAANGEILTTGPDSLIAVFWDQLTGFAAHDGGVFFDTLGTAPNRKAIVQWEVYDGSTPVVMICQLVLFESSNLIKMQYRQVDAGFNGGGSATVGIKKSSADGIEYFYDPLAGPGPLEGNFAILFHNRVNDGTASAKITPSEGQAGEYTSFTYTIYDISTSGPDGLGKADYFEFSNPFLTTPTVTSISINGSQAYIQNSQNKPDEPGYASWYYNSGTLEIRTSFFETADSINITFGQTLPGTPGGGHNYSSTFDAAIDQSSAGTSTNAGYTVTVNAGAVSYYSFNPPGIQTPGAGGTVFYTLTARDQFGNAVENFGSVDLSTPGSSTAVLAPATTIDFNGADNISFNVRDDKAGSFSVYAENTVTSTINGQSAEITVSAGTASVINILSSELPIEIGTDRSLRVSLEDAYGNGLPGENLLFERFYGSGTFDNGTAIIPVTTDANGQADTNYTASQELSFIRDSIEVSFGSVRDTIVLPLAAASVTNYTFSPAGDQNPAAGEGVSFTVTARDQFGNASANSDVVTLSSPGSSTAVFSPGNIIDFDGNDNISFTVTDDAAGTYSVRVVNNGNSRINGESGLITVSPNDLDYVLIRSEAGNSGVEVQDLTLSTDDSYSFYAAGYDQYGNFIADTSVNWGSTPTLESVAASGSKFVFSPAENGEGQITATPVDVLVTPDATGTITVNEGSLAELRIQTNDQDGGPVLGDTGLTAGGNLTLYAVGYDADGNYLGRIAANWDSSGAVDRITPANPTDNIDFEASIAGTGTIMAEAASDASISDRSGLITITAGPAAAVKIRTEPGNQGIELDTKSMTVGQTIDLFAAGYDSYNNYTGETAVDWHVNNGLTGLGDSLNVSSTTLTPLVPGQGFVSTESSYNDDQTGTITVVEGTLAELRIQTESAADGQELGTYSGDAGTTLDVFAAGYDNQGNFLGLQNVLWTEAGNDIGFFDDTDSTDQNTFNFRTVNTAQFKISKNSLSDFSEIITVNPGPPANVASSPADTSTAQVNQYVNDSLLIKITDAYGNNVPNTAVNWSTDTGGALSPANDLTDAQGVSRSRWRVKSTTGLDSARADIPAVPGPVWFYAQVVTSTADSMTYISGTGQTQEVTTRLADPFVIRVLDSLDNPVQGAGITFSAAGPGSYPAGGGDYEIETVSALTDANGYASTFFTLGSAAGTYQVSAYNSQLRNSPIVFTAQADAADAAEITVVSGNGQTGTAGAALAQAVRVRIIDAYGNPKAGTVLNWLPSADGSVSAAGGSSTTDAGGYASTTWTLRTASGSDTLNVSSGALPQAQFTAVVNPDAVSQITAYSGNETTTIAGGTKTVEAQALDQFGNFVPDASVIFEPSAKFSNQTVNTNAQGLASSVFTTSAGTDSAEAKAYITGLADTAFFKIYGVTYVSSTLSPGAANTGDNVVFRLDVKNPGINDVDLNLSETLFSFSDGTNTVTAVADSPAVLSAQTDAVTIRFAGTTIDQAFVRGIYTPQVSFAGEGADINLNGVLSADGGELAIDALEIDYVRVQDPVDKNAVRGGSLNTVIMQVSNSSIQDVDILESTLTFNPELGFIVTPDGGNPAVILANDQAILSFSVEVPGTAPVDTITVDGYIRGRTSVSLDILADNDADLTDEFYISSGLDLTYLDFSPKIVSENQQAAFEVTVQSGGNLDYLLNSSSTRLVFGGQTFNLNGNQTIAPLSQTVLEFTEAAVTLPAGPNQEGVLYLSGTENSQVVEDTLYTSAENDSLEIQTRADLAVTEISLNNETVLRGSIDTLKIAVQNTGQASAVIASDDSVKISYNAEYTFTPLQSYPFTLTGGQIDTLYYRVKVAADAVTGRDTIRAAVSYNDLNSSTVYTFNNPAVYADWLVTGIAASLDLLSVQSDFNFVSTGQDSIPVLVRVENNSLFDVRVDSIRLSLPAADYEESSILRLTNRTLVPAERDTFGLNVVVRSTASSGPVSLNAKVYGFNVSNSNVLFDLDADTTDSWLVQQAAALTVLDNSPVQISSGQELNPTALVRNDGEASLIFDTANSSLQVSGLPGLTRTLVSPASIAGGQTAELIFESDDASGVSGSYSVDLNLRGTENNSFYNNTLPAPNDLTIQTPADIVINFVSASAVNIAQGADTVVSVSVSNAGEADMVLDSLTVLPYTNSIQSIEPALPISIAAGSGRVFTVSISLPEDAATGLITLDAQAFGRDSNWVNAGFNSTLEQLNADITDQWTVYEPAGIQVSSITSSQSVLNVGQADIPVEVTITNTGGSPAQITGHSLAKRIGLYTYQYPALNFTVAAAAETTITDILSVRTNSATGLDTLNALLDFTDLYSQRSSSYQSSEQLIWRITSSESAVNILSVQTSRNSVSHGHQDQSITVRVKNNGDGPVMLDSLQLQFTNNVSSAYEIGAPSPAPGFLDSEAEAVFTIPINVNETANTGTDLVSAEIFVTESISGESYWVADPTITGTWDVKERPEVVINRIFASPATVSEGQQDLSVSVVVSNSEGADRAPASLESASLSFSLEGQDRSSWFTVNRESTPSLPLVLLPGDSSRLDFTVDLTPSAEYGDYIINSSVISSDIYSGIAENTTVTVNPGNLTVQQQASLQVQSAVFVPDTLYQGQSGGLVNVSVQNTGEAPVQVNLAELNFNPGLPEIDFEPAITAQNTPFTLNSGQSRTITFSIIAGTETYSGAVSVDASVQGTDLNSGAVLQNTLNNADIVQIQTPPDISWLDTNPNESSQDEDKIFTVTLRNDGQTKVDLDRSGTSLEIWDNNFGVREFIIPLAAASTARILPDAQQTNLVFEETMLSGIDEGDYRFFLKLKGSANYDNSFEQSLNAGILAYGDSVISIKRISANKANAVWGEKDILVSMFVKNSVEPKSIDPLGTRLIFRDEQGGLLAVENYRRTDTLTVMQQQNNNELTFAFDIPDEFYAGSMRIYGQVSFDGGSLILESTSWAALEVSSGGEAQYVSGSLSPDIVVARQKPVFSAVFTNSGTADINLQADSSYIEIQGTSADRMYLAGGYLLKGEDPQSGQPVNTSVTFEEGAIPADISPGQYNVYWYLNGKLPDNQTVISTGTIVNGLTAVQGADLVFSQIVIDSAVARQGQEDISIRVQLANQGQSPASITKIKLDFDNVDLGASASDDWSVQTAPDIPDTLAGGSSVWYNYTFNLSSDAGPGRHRPQPAVTYTDLRTPFLNRTSTAVTSNDLISVVSPALVRIDSLTALQDLTAPNAPNVNTGQSFSLELAVANPGSDEINLAVISLYRNNVLRQEIIAENIAPGAVERFMVNQSIGQAGTYTFRAVIDSAFDNAGSRIGILQPLDNIEQLQVMSAADLSASAVISSPAGAVDSVLSNGQVFRVRADISNSGEALIGSGRLKLNLPQDYSFKDDTLSIKEFTQEASFAEWDVRIEKQTVSSDADSLFITVFEAPDDINTGQPAQLTKAADTLLVNVLSPAAVINAPMEIVEPAGAADGILSTGQEIVLRSKFTFNETSADSGRLIKLMLPDGWSVQDSASINLNAYALDDSVDWIVNVPSAVPAGGDSFYTVISGLDENSRLPFSSASLKTGYTVVPRSSLVLNLQIVEPAGAVDDTLSTDQVFRLQGLVTNLQQAAAAPGQGNAHIRTGSSFSLSDSEGNLLPVDSVRSFNVGQPVDWWIKVSAAAERMNLASSALLSTLEDNQIEVELVDIPADENSGLPAFVQNAAQVKSFIVEEKAEILTVTSLSQETLSTGQSFIFKIQAELNASISDVRAALVLPGTLGPSPDAAVPLNDDNQAQWILDIPEDYSGTGNETITVNVSGVDENSGQTVQMSSPMAVQIEHKAVLTLSSLNVEPFSVWNSGLASRGQKITISIKPGYAQKLSALDYAGFVNSGSIVLDSALADQGFELDEGMSYEQNFSSFDDVLTWTVKAPQADLTTAFNLRFANLPLDENSLKAAAVGGDSASVTVPIRVRQKTIIVTILKDVISDTTLTNPADNVPILGFNVSNREYDDNLNIKGLKLQFVSAEGSAFSTQSLKSMMQSLSIVDISEVQEALSKESSLSSVHSFVEYAISDTTANPLILEFDQEVQIAPRGSAGLAVLARFKDNVVNRSFKTILRGVNVYDFNPDTPLEIIDSTGTDIAESELLDSKEFSLVSENPKDDFGNYPNPFGRQHKRTNIAFRLTADSDVDIRIFTLTGGLVWTKKLLGLNEGLHKTPWNGRNDKGHLVLNGVYLCSIEIRPVSGGSTKRYITKIAFIK